MTTIYYNDDTYFLRNPRYQCLTCNEIVERLFHVCSCGKVIIQRGQRKDMNDARDVSIWISKSGRILPQYVLDRKLGLRREADEASAYTESSTRTSRSPDRRSIDVEDGERSKRRKSDHSDFR